MGITTASLLQVHPPEGPNEPPEEVGQPPPHVRDEFFTTRLDAKKIGEKLAKASAFLKQFEEDIVEPEAIAAGLNAERAVASLNGEDADFSYDADVYTVARSREALVKWLIGGEKICPMNLAKVREFMRRGLPEMAARKASLTFTNTSVEVAADLYRQKRAELEQNAEWQALDNQIRGWPAIATVEALVREAIDSAVALQLLYIAKNNTRKTTSILIDDYRASRAQGAVQAPAAIAEPAVEEPEPDYEELALLREENERDAIEQDALLDDVNWEPVKKQKGSKKIDAQLKTYLPYIKATLPFPEDYQVVTRAEQAQSLVDRWRLYQTWVDEAKFQLEVEMDVLQKEYGTALKRISELRSLGDLAVLKEAKVVGMTTTGAAMHQAALRALKPRIVIVEEAAEVLEAHLLTSLTVACEHAILIGDHKQLRPNPAVYELAKKYNFDVSLFERLIKNQFPYRMLKNQHRMRPEISRTLMPFFYPELEDDASVHGRDNVLGMQKNMVFINHNAPELMDNEVKSHSNPFEAEYAIRLAIYVMQQGYDVSDVTILCTYLEQLLTLRRQAKNHPILDGIRIDNVDNYQGEESKIIILSLVRSTNPRGNIGFLSVPNRVCVALSRAKDGFYVFGNFDFLASKCELWKNIREKVKEKGMLYNYLPVRCQNHGFEQQILTPKDFDAKCPEGGCRTACNVRLDCGHTCEKPCHPLDAEHKQRKCTKPCGRTCAARHPCKKLCFEDCGSCKVKVEKTLPCGHKKVVACGQKPEAVKCPEPCQRSLVCGHRCKEKCSTACTAKCVEPVRRRMPCGHPMTMKCFEKTSEVKCTAKVMKKWSRCNHTTETECSANVDAVPCPKPCDANIPGCEHKCEGTCGQCRNGRLHIQCRKECGRTLICGHPCDSKCSKTCPPCSRPCETACAHSQCSKAGSFDGQQMKLRKNPDHKDHRKKVGRLCGDACPPCLEPCLNRCEHRECSRKCSEPCDVQPCSEPCKKPLKCSPKEEGAEPHLCIGVCGEDCIDVCRVCDPEKFAELREIFLGSEEEEDARFVRLKDCSHVFEVSGLDKCVQGALGAAKKAEEQQIVTIRCPKCSTPIRRSKRYAHILSQRATDIEQGKRVVRGSDKDALTLEWREYLEEFRRFFKSYQDLIEPSVKAEYNYTKDGSLIAFGHDLKFMLKQFEELSAASITSAWMNTARNTLRVLERMCKLIKAICDSGASRLRGQGGVPASMPRLRTVLQTELPISVNMPCLLTFLQTKVPKYGDLWKYVADDFCFLLDVIRNKEHLKPSQAVSDTLLQQFSYECQRLSFIIDLAKWIVKAVDYGRDLDQTAAATLKAILGTLDCGKEFVGEHERIMKHYMEMLMNQHKLSGFALSQQEIVEITKALGSHVTQWYRCSKGHVYGIGECGMAMVRSRCPECQEEIGGEDHRLVATSQQALEMTGGRPPPPPPNPFVVRFGPEW
ncbi:NFX1-type zinc finger-containing protein 1-like protein [Aphelenchoides avenae]|nr:NFX1-type zinc finger-containing protein 1-like protein [Aphelenchus avenae]